MIRPIYIPAKGLYSSKTIPNLDIKSRGPNYTTIVRAIVRVRILEVVGAELE